MIKLGCLIVICTRCRVRLCGHGLVCVLEGGANAIDEQEVILIESQAGQNCCRNWRSWN